MSNAPALILLWTVLLAQPGNILSVPPPAKVVAKRNSSVEAKISVSLLSGYHVNSNRPADDYLIPLQLTWTGGPVAVEEVVYPKPQMGRYTFSPKPISVFTGNFNLITKFRVPNSAPIGPAVLQGKLRYQACDETACYPPKTIEVKLPLQIQ